MDTKKLVVAYNKRFLMTETGEPFFWLGDTGWLLFSRLNKQEAEHYLEVRRSQGFNVIQVMAIHNLPTENVFGNAPFLNNDPSQPLLVDDEKREGYWEHIDDIIEIAAAKGLYVAIVPVWGSVVKAGKVNKEQAKAYGEFLGKRYGSLNNIIWLNGGDVEGDRKMEVWDALGESIKAEAPDQLMTFHPFGRTQSSTWFHDRDWLDFNMFQSGHRRYGQTDKNGKDGDHFGESNWRYVVSDYALDPIKPTIDGEPSYELIPHGLHDPSEPWWQPDDVRRYAYWAVFAGAFGHTYGHSSVMQMHNSKYPLGDYGAKKYWDEAIFDLGGIQMQYLKSLICNYPFFERIPDQSVVIDPGEGYQRVLVTRGKTYLLAYTYTGRSFSLKLGIIEGEHVKAIWYDPKTGKRSESELILNQGAAKFNPPGEVGEGKDWVLILESEV